jgi:hypothetical protein
VTTGFLAKLERRLKANVTVTIAHGYGNDESGSHANALKRLSNLANRYKRQFSFVRMKNTHAQILIFDDRWISTSFNWLSFRGDPERTYAWRRARWSSASRTSTTLTSATSN